VRATALNRADLLQRRGKHPPPRASRTSSARDGGRGRLGGHGVRGMGAGGPGVRPAAGGRVRREGEPPRGACDADPRKSLLRAGRGDSRGVPDGVPEPVQRGTPRCRSDGPDPRGASGVGTAAIQLVREAGGYSLVTAGSPEKIARCIALGARAGWNYKDGPFARGSRSRPGGAGRHRPGFVGAPYFEQNLQTLAADGGWSSSGRWEAPRSGRSACGPSCRSGF